MPLDQAMMMFICLGSQYKVIDVSSKVFRARFERMLRSRIREDLLNLGVIVLSRHHQSSSAENNPNMMALKPVNPTFS